MNDDSFTVNGTKQLVNVVKFTRKLGKLKGQNKEKKKEKLKKLISGEQFIHLQSFFFHLFFFTTATLFCGFFLTVYLLVF